MIPQQQSPAVQMVPSSSEQHHPHEPAQSSFPQLEARAESLIEPSQQSHPPAKQLFCDLNFLECPYDDHGTFII